MICERCAREIQNAEPEARPDLASLNLMELPFVEASDFYHLPRCGGVYFALAADKVCYIGIATNLYFRWRGHISLSRLLAVPGSRIAWIVQSDKVERENIEREAIKHFRPLWNVGGAEYLDLLETMERFPKARTRRRSFGDIPIPP